MLWVNIDQYIILSYYLIGAIYMIIMSVTDFSRNMKSILNKIEYQGEEVLLIRNKKKVVKLVPQISGGTALEVFSDLYRTLPDIAGETWLADSRTPQTIRETRDPWDT